MFWFVLQCFGRLQRKTTSSRRLGYPRAIAGPPEPLHDLPHDLHPDSLSRLFVSPSPERVMPGIDVVRETGLKEGQSTPGILREQAFESSNVLVSRTRLDPAAVSGWHHHRTPDLYGFLLSGRLRLEYGTTGSEAGTVSPGDLIHIPPGLVHLVGNPDRATWLIGGTNM